MTKPKRAPNGAAWSIHHKGASRCLDEGCDKFAPFCFSVAGNTYEEAKIEFMGNDNLRSFYKTWLVRIAGNLWSVIFAFASIAATAESDKPDVFYGGFAFSGNGSDVGKSFPNASSLNTTNDDGTNFLDRVAREFFQKNRDRFKRMNLQFGGARREDTPLVLALALTDEKVLRDEFNDFHKLVIQLGFEMLILNFKELEVVSSQPICIEFIDAGKEPFDDAAVRERMKKMVEGADSQLLPAVLGKADRIQPRSKNQCTLQVRQVSIGEKALPFLPELLRQNTNAYAQTVAQQFGSFLTSKAGVALLPYAKDELNAKMALIFSDGSAVQFKIPKPTFALDLEVKGFKKVLDKSTDAEALWIYGAFLGIRVYEPEFNTVYLDVPVKYGVSKVVPATQKIVDEFPVVSDALKGAFLSAIEHMQKDKNTNEKVLKKCAL
jgi:hypothetical protein